MTNWTDFFRLVLPDLNGAVYAIGTGQDGPTNTTFVDGIDALITRANDLQAQPNVSGANYFSIAAINKTDDPKDQARNKKLCAGNRALVLDIDARAAKPDHFNTPEEALQVLYGLCQSHSLPAPSAVIHSGGGLHVYWAFTKDISGSEYHDLGTALVNWLRPHEPKLVSDPKVTKNEVAYIRLPGSMNNRQTPAHRVGHYTLPDGSVLSSMQAHDPDDLRKFLGVAAPAQGAPGGGRVARVMAAVENLAEGMDFATGCNVMRWIKDNRKEPPTSPAYIDYSVWRSAMALLSFCDNAEDAAQAWSEGAPTYDPAAVAKQINIEIANRANVTGPMTCAALCDSLPGSAGGRSLCQGCPFYRPDSGTPYRAAQKVQLEREIGEAVNDEAVQTHTLAAPAATTVNPNASGPMQIIREVGPGLETKQWLGQQHMLNHSKFMDMAELGVNRDPDLWAGKADPVAFNASGEFVASVPDGQGGFVEEGVASCGLWPLRIVNDADADTSSVQVCLARFENGTWRARLALLGYEVVGGRVENFIKELARLNVFVPHNPKLQNTLFTWFRSRCMNLQHDDALNVYNQFGWSETPDGYDFILGNFRFRPDGNYNVAILGDKTKGLARDHFKLDGTFDGVRSVLDYMWHKGTDEAIFGLCIGAGAPMTYRSATDGVYVNLYGANGAGKSLLSNIIAGMWGSGSRDGAHITTKDTANSRYAKLAAFASLPVIHDEATQLHNTYNDTDDMGNYLYDISGGKSKGRALRDGSAANTQHWKTVVIATSNSYLRQVATGFNETVVAQMARAYELPIIRPIVNEIDTPTTNKVMQQLGWAIGASPGVAGMYLSKYLVQNRAQLEQDMDNIIDQLTRMEQDTSAEARIRRSAVALAMIGGKMLIDTGLMPSANMVDLTAKLMRADAVVKRNAANTDTNPLMLLTSLVHGLASNTGVVQVTPSGVTNIKTSQAGGQPAPGRSTADKVIDPRFDLKLRMDWTVGQPSVRVSIDKTTFVERLSRRDISWNYLMQQLKLMGFNIWVENVTLYKGIGLPSRENYNNMGPSAHVPCVCFDMKLDTTASGAAPVFLPPDKMLSEVA